MADDPKPMFKGLMCRRLTCCCKPGEGHNDPAWIAWEARQRCDPANDELVTPHRGCIMR